MYVITVLFSTSAEHASEFLQAMVANARTSVAEEPGCRQFDVCVSDRNPNDVFLYEVYDSKAAFGLRSETHTSNCRQPDSSATDVRALATIACKNSDECSGLVLKRTVMTYMCEAFKK